MKDIFVIGGCHHNILGVIRSLGEKGVSPCVIIESKESNPYVIKSKYIKQFWKVDNEQQVLEILRSESRKYDVKPVLIACADNLSSMLDVNYNELSCHYILPGSKQQGHITKLMNKEVMRQLALDVGFIVPNSKATDTAEENEIDVPFPWIIKPLISKNGAKTDIVRIYSPQEWNNYKNHHQLRVQVQKLIDKDFEYQIIGLSLNSGEEIVVPGISHIIRPAATTNTGFLRYEPLDKNYQEILSLCQKFLQKTDYSGPFSMEFLHGKDGKDYFMEINFRNDGNAICVTAAGVNLSYIWYLYNTGGDYQKELFNTLKPVYVMPEFADLSLIRHGQLSIWTWLQDILRTDRFMEFDKNDNAPFWCYLMQRIIDCLKRF